MHKILLIGGTGKLGSAVLAAIDIFKYDVGLLIRNISNRNLNNFDKNWKIFEGDITIQQSLCIAFEWADIIINCSGYVSYKKSDLQKLRLLNIESVKNIVAVASQYNKKLIHTSSAVIYGSSRKPIAFKETYLSEKNYKSGYSFSKIESEKIVQESNISYVILRPSSLILKGNSTIAKLFNMYKKGLILNFKGGASFVSSKDIAKAYISTLQKIELNKLSYQEIFNLGGNNLTIKNVFFLFKCQYYRKTYTIGNFFLFILSLLNDFLLYPLFHYSFITLENFYTGNHFTFIDSAKAAQLLDYNITPIKQSLKEIV